MLKWIGGRTGRAEERRMQREAKRSRDITFCFGRGKWMGNRKGRAEESKGGKKEQRH